MALVELSSENCGDFLVEADDGVALKCLDHADSWCDHLEAAITEGADSVEIFSEEHSEIAAFVCVVPIFPTYNIFDSVVLTWIPFAVPALQVSRIESDPITESDFGILAEGDGRRVIREMLLNDFIAKVNNADLPIVCKSKSHKFAEEMQLAKNVQSDRMTLIERWCVAKIGKCLTCFTRSTGEDFSDLVPDKDRANW